MMASMSDMSKKKISEADIENWLNNQMRKIGGLSRKWVSPGNPGVPDRIYILPGGKIYFVELKTETGKFSKLQKWQLAELKRMGCRIRKVKGMEQAKELIEEFKHEIQSA